MRNARSWTVGQLVEIIRENPSHPRLNDQQEEYYQGYRSVGQACHPRAIEKASDHQPKVRSGEWMNVDFILILTTF